MTITYVPYSQIAPQFGRQTGDEILIREDLPGNARAFLLAHETFHVTDKASNWIWRELRANLAGFRANWIGFLIVLAMSMNPVRLRYYWQRCQKGE